CSLPVHLLPDGGRTTSSCELVERRALATILRSADALVAKHAIDIDLFRVLPGRRLTLERHDPTNTFPFDNKAGTGRLLQRRVRRLYELTELLYAQNRWSVLFIFQALDGAGKDSAIKHVMRGLDPKSTQVYSFKSPSSEELRHDFMWRCMKSLPERGRIG